MCTWFNILYKQCQEWATTVNLDGMAVTAVQASLHSGTTIMRDCTGLPIELRPVQTLNSLQLPIFMCYPGYISSL